MHASLNIAESTDGSRGSLAGPASLGAGRHLPVVRRHEVHRLRGERHLHHRVLELATAIALIAGAFNPIAIGAAA
jgi:hypothetical protein